MPRFDILFFDLDGTLLGPDHTTVSPRNQEALRAASAAGVKLSFATGRCLKIISPEAMALGLDYAVTSNGAAVYDLKQDKQLYHFPFPVEQAAAACRIIGSHIDFYELFVNGEILLGREEHDKTATRHLPPWHRRYFERHLMPVVESIDAFIQAGAPGLEKLNLVECDPADIACIRDELEALNLFELTTSLGRGALEAVPKGCTKGSAIRWLCNHLGIDIARSAAFGDGGNDREMLLTAGCGVAMGNAPEELKKAAACVTTPYDEDGIARFIEQYVL